MSTFTDLDVYETMQRHLPMIFWPTWERAGQEVRAGVARIADELYERLRGPGQPHEKPAGTESAGPGHLTADRAGLVAQLEHLEDQ